MIMKTIRNIFTESLETKKKLMEGDQLEKLVIMGDFITEAIMDGKKLILCGNGGSAADAQHLAAELLIRLRPAYNREGVPAIALAQDTSTITACGNDFGYEKLYERLIKTLGNRGDIFIGITTSGNSENIIRAMKAARDMDIKVFGYLGNGGGKAIEFCDEAFIVPSNNTGRIQEMHITAGHALMEYVEDTLIDKEYIHVKK